MTRSLMLTKHGHSSFSVGDGEASVLFDPGSLTEEITVRGELAAIVITHDHPDHWTPEWLDRVRSSGPAPVVYTTAAVAERIGTDGAVVVESDRAVQAGPFTLAFTRTTHARVHASVPAPENLGCLVDGVLYYGGDAFVLPAGVEPEVLAVPLAAPWMKLGEAIDYVLEAAPRRTFPVHDRVLSAAGRDLAIGRIEWATGQRPGAVLLDPADGSTIAL
jgi:L-ascorbate metabolism protein UlaG (beta-lactamase superfamily)